MRLKTFAQLATEWDTLLMNSLADLDALPHAKKSHDELKEGLDRLVQLNEQIQVQRSELQSVVKERQLLAKTAKRPRKALENLLLAEFGDDSQRLVRYGISPRQPRKRPTKTEIRNELLEEIKKGNVPMAGRTTPES